MQSSFQSGQIGGTGRKFGDPKEFILSQIRQNAANNKHMPVMFHDDTVWIDVLDKDMKYLLLVSDTARENGYELVTHIECYHRKHVWHGQLSYASISNA